MKKRTLATMIVLVLAVCVVIGGTLAYLTATTDTVENTFTVGHINATLDEKDVDESTSTEDGARDTENKYKVIPGDKIEKDPTVHVLEGSEKCYVYICIDDGLNAAVAGSATYTVGADWTKIGDTENGRSIYKYASVVDASSEQKDLLVFDGVSIDGAVVTEQNIDDLDGRTIVVNAYLHQSANVDEAVAEAAALAYFGTITNPNTPPTPVPEP